MMLRHLATNKSLRQVAGLNLSRFFFLLEEELTTEMTFSFAWGTDDNFFYLTSSSIAKTD